MDSFTDAELLTAYRQAHPDKTGEVSSDELDEFRAEVEQRLHANEREALDLLRRTMYQAPSRTGANSRHFQFALKWLFFTVIVALALFWVVSQAWAVERRDPICRAAPMPGAQFMVRQILDLA